MKKLIVLALLSLAVPVQAQDIINYKPKNFLLTAHPNHDVIFSATVWKTTKLLGGKVDIALMANGEGAYKYSTLANYVYGLGLDNEEAGRAS